MEQPRVLYLVYWGAAEPLGQSLVVPAVTRLARLGVKVTLVTYDKPTDLKRKEEIDRIRAELENHGISWIALQYHKRPKIPATAFDIAHGWARALLSSLVGRVDVIHARTFIGGLVGMALSRVMGARWIYHNEGFYPDEQVDGGVWRSGSRIHRVARYLERRMYESAEGLIVLSQRARGIVERMPAVLRKKTPTIVVRSCVDLERFRLEPRKVRLPQDEIRLVYIGSIGYRYIFERIAQFVAASQRELGGVRLRVLSRKEPEVIDAALRVAGAVAGSWSVDAVPHEAMPGELRGQDAGLFFLTQGLSEHGCSPTKIGEYWAMGLPVVTTPNVSDTDEIVHRHRVGVIVREHSETEYRRAARELRGLLDDPALGDRCRAAAEQHYGLEDACERQVKLYWDVLAKSGGSRAS